VERDEAGLLIYHPRASHLVRELALVRRVVDDPSDVSLEILVKTNLAATQ
jgi:hypothetical protein